ncbi:MAG: hypothetical protein MUF04_00630 [Akkermansiaceae bacterium]|nr:hypothetical protein [Akkermansiaceae bacterium]
MKTTPIKSQKKRLLLASLAHWILAVTVQAGPVTSDGSDGAFNPAGFPVLDLNSMAPDGVLNFTTVHIPAGVVVKFVANNLNTPVFLAATGDILIEGTIEVSARDYFVTAGPGGGAAGMPVGLLATAGGGGAGGQPGGPATTIGPNGRVMGNAGGGGGMATAGLVASSRTGADPGLGGAAIPRPVLTPGTTGGGGSGGGAGSGIDTFGVLIPGGAGGGGGGALQLSTPGTITITGSILANGGHAQAGYGNGLSDSCGPGGGGAGGNLEMYAGRLVLGSTAVIQARGGAGGGLSSEPVSWDPFFYSNGANGGLGYLFIQTNDLQIDPAAGIEAMANLNPKLGIRKEGAQVVVHWPTPAPRFFLQESPDLSAGSWTDVTTPVVISGGENRVTVTPGLRNFYRLIQR